MSEQDAGKQIPLFEELVKPDYGEGMTIDERFEVFHKANPHVYDLIHQRALALRRRGIKRFGLAAIYEGLRYDYAVQTGGDKFKLNNDYRAIYSRMIMENDPELAGFFEKRERTSVTRRQRPKVKIYEDEEGEEVARVRSWEETARRQVKEIERKAEESWNSMSEEERKRVQDEAEGAFDIDDYHFAGYSQ